MNRTILTVAGVLSASSLLLVDSAVNGTVLLALAAVAALILRRDSAATRHLVWLLAIVAMLVVPVLSALLPQWRVLPAWMSSPSPVVADVSPPSIVLPAGGAIESPQRAAPVEVERPIASVDQRVSALPDPRPASVTPEAVPAPAVRSWNWINALPLVWVIGFAVLMLRLSAARWMLWNSERLATVIRGRVAPQLAAESRSDSATAHDPIVTAMEAICSQLGIGRPVTLLIHPNKTIPVVWGILRCRLMLPAAARQWSDEQLQSVLLHELAHIKRRDTIVQLLAQVACALHWFNPLVWFAAWRLDVERERSCDDLVLASGIRPSAYAGHLLDVVTGLSPARWTQACGLAMARKSSLEGRLTAVLGKDLNRRDVSVALAGLALAIAVGVAVPIAMLRAADEKWNPPSGAHIGGNAFSALCVHDGKDAAFVIAYHGDFDSTSRSSSNAKSRTWTNSGTLIAKKPDIELGFQRTHTAPGKLSITTAPASVQDLFKREPAPRHFGQKEYDLAKGRVFLLTDSGLVRQLDIATPVVTDQESAKKLAALIAAIPPQEHQDVALTTNLTGKLAPETVAKLKWGEPVNGLRMALAWPPSFDEELLGSESFFQLVVQNVSNKEIHFHAGDNAPNPRELTSLANDRAVLVFADEETAKADWHLQAGHCGVLRMFMKEMHGYYGTVSAGIERDLSKIDGNLAVAEMEVAKAPADAWTGKLVTGQTRGSADKADAPAPKHKNARSLYEVWQHYARANGDIPGGLIGELAGSVKLFIKLNPTWETVPKLNAILPRLDATHDWKSADAIALLDEVAGIQDSPLKGAVEKATRSSIRKGEVLPKKYAKVRWGDLLRGGTAPLQALHAAWVLEPDAAEHRLGEAVKARLLVGNQWPVPFMVQVPTFHQGGVKATDAKGAEVEVSGISWTTLAQLVPVRLAPGEYIEINTPGIGFGPRAGMGPWAGPRVGSNVLAKAGDELTLTHGLVPLDGSEVGVSEDDPHVSGPGWWLAHIKARLNRELPLPADAAERTRMLDRAVRELFATAPTAEETAAFIADKTPDALDALAKRLVARVDVVSFSGKLPTAPAKFRVLAADAKGDKRPRVVLGPGEYPLPSATAERGDATLKIVGRSVGDRRTNDAQLLFEATEFTGARPPDPPKLEVPDGWGTWATVCRPDSDFFYLLSKGTVRKIDYSKPRKVTDTPANDLPAEFRDEVKRILDIHEISAGEQAEIFEKPAAPAATPDSQAGAIEPAQDEAPVQPKHEYAQSLFRKWQASARTDGKIPGALIGHLARTTDDAVQRSNDADVSAKLAALRPRLDVSRDWTQAEAVALLDDITAISTAPVSWADTAMQFSSMRIVRQGEPLPVELHSAAWGAPASNGLRAAWRLEPHAEQYALGSVLKARVLFHNTGKAPVVFETETWHQQDKHTARDMKGAEISVQVTWFTGITPMSKFRLAPGEYCEVSGHGIAIGAGEYLDERSTGAVGAIVEAKDGDTVTLSQSVDAGTGGWTRPDDLWLVTVAGHVANEAPMPASAADREQLIRRVTLDILGVEPTAEEIAAFTADDTPDALATLTARLQAKPHVEPWTGKLPTGETKFRVIAADPSAAKAPRTANAPGRYVLGDKVHLQITQTNVNPYRVGSVPFLQNKSTIIFPAPAPEAARGPKPYEIVLPNGIGTYGIVWERGAGVLWVMQKDLARKYDFTNPWKVQETRFAEGGIINIPEHLREAMKKAFDVPDAPVQQPASEKPTRAAAPKLPKLPDDAYAKLGVHCQSFREEDAKRPGGELMGGALEPSKPEDRNKEPLVLGIRTASDAQWRIGGTAKVGLVVRNRTGGIGRNQPGSDVKFSYTGGLDSGLSVVAVDEAGKEHEATIAYFDGKLTFQHMLLPVAHVVTIKEFTIRFDAEKRDVSEPRVAAFHLPPGKYKLRCKWDDARPDVAHEGEWTGELVNEEFEFTLAAAVAVQPASETPKTTEQEAFTAWGKEVGGLQAGFCITNASDIHIGGKIKAVVKLRNVSKESVSVSAVPLWELMSPPKVVDSQGKPVRTTDGPYPLLSLTPKNLTLKPGEAVDVDKTEIPVAALNQDVKVPDKVADRRIIHVEPGKYKVNWTESFVQEHSELSTGIAEFEVKAAKEPFTAWGKEVGGLQAGLGFKAGGKRAYTHGEWTTLVVRVRNVGKEEVKFQYLRQFFVEQPPTVFNEKGELKQLGRTTAFGEHIPVEMKLAAGKEIELYELKLYLGTGSEEGKPKYPYIFGTGRFQIQYEKVLGNSSSGSIKLEPALSKLATGKLELEVKEPAADPPKTETPKGADAAAPFRDKLAELDAKIAALKMERVKLSETLAPNHPKIRKLDAEVEAFEEARASFIATNPQALSPKPPEAPKPLLPPVANPASVAQPLPEFVFARRDWSRSAKVAVADGVTVAIHEEVINRADIMATARIRYTAADGTVTGHDLLLASDAAGSRAKWAYGWMRGTKTFWYCSVSPDNSYSLHRVSFADPQRITDDFQQYYPGEKPQRTLDVPDAFYAQLVDVLGFQKWTVVDKGNGLPEISGQNMVSSRALTPDGVPVKAATSLPLSKDKRWKVQFVDAATGQPVLRLRATVTSRTADGLRTIHVMKVVSDGAFERNLTADEHAWVSVADEAWSNADDAVRLFGNVPADTKATETHTDPDAPFIVKVKPRVKQVKAGTDADKPAAKPPGANMVKLPNDQYVKSGVPVAELNVPMTWSAEQNGLCLGMHIPKDADWRVGKEVKVELWIKNPTGKDAKFQNVARNDHGLRVLMKGNDGKEHEAVIIDLFLEFPVEKLLLPSVHAVKVREFSVVFLPPGSKPESENPVFALAPGEYKFRCEHDLIGTIVNRANRNPLAPPAIVRAGLLKSGEVDVKLVAADAPAPKPRIAPADGAIRGKVLKPDGSPAAGVQVRVDDGIERWKFRGEGIPDLPKGVKTAADGTFSIEVPKHSVATNYEAFASSDDFAPLNAKVLAGGDVGVMQFTKGSRVTGRVIGLDGAGLAKVGIWCKQLEWHGRGPAPSKLTSTSADGTFSIPSIAAGKYLLVILTRDLATKELTVAFANHVIEAKDDAPITVEIRPLPTVNLTLDVRVLRGKPEFPDFELRVSGTLPGHKAGEPASYWTRQETTKLTEGKHAIAVPAGLQNATVRADRIYMRKDDEPAFTWQREGDEKRISTNTLELGLIDQPQTISLTVQDAPAAEAPRTEKPK